MMSCASSTTSSLALTSYIMHGGRVRGACQAWTKTEESKTCALSITATVLCVRTRQ